MIVYHNPRCSKSRQAVALCEEAGLPFDIVEYLKVPPTRPELEKILEGLGGDIGSMTRAADLKKAGLEPSLDVLVENPQYLQRPILVQGDRVAVARTPEAIKEFLEDLS